jgi:hypothetical protein
MMISVVKGFNPVMTGLSLNFPGSLLCSVLFALPHTSLSLTMNPMSVFLALIHYSCKSNRIHVEAVSAALTDWSTATGK